jgi:methionine synthase II (cobalamin-independent)
MKFEPKCLSTGIGSLPHTDVDTACRLVVEQFPEIPFWPQFPKLSYYESMYVQYSENVPGLKIDNNKITIDLFQDLDDEFEKFYMDYMAGRTENFGQSQDYVQGLYKLLELGNEMPEVKAVKGQITGPVSFGLQVLDDRSTPIFYDNMLRDILIKNIKMKAQWQEKMLSQICERTIISVDEPYLTSIGSGTVNLDPVEVKDSIQEVLSFINGLKGIHCCGNTDWPLLMDTSIDILFIDAFSYAKNLSLYPSEVQAFLDRGGIIGWGIVPSIGEDIKRENVVNLANKFESSINLLLDKGINKDILLNQSLITPSCGLGSNELEEAEKALRLTNKLSKILRKKYEFED